MRIRMVVEYDPDWLDLSAEERTAQLELEKKDWLEGNVAVSDVEAIGGKVTWEIIP